MKFHEPETEQRLMRLAREGLAAEGLTMEAAAGWKWENIKIALYRTLWAIFATVLLFLLMGGADEGAALRDPAWQMLLSGTALLVVALLLSQQLITLGFRPPTAFVLRQLPVPGAKLARWGLEEMLKEMSKRTLLLLVCAWGMKGFPLEAAALPGILVRAVLLAVMVLATVMLMPHPWVVKARLPRIWLVVMGVTALLCGWLYFNQANLPPTLPGWMLALAEGLSWVLPASWVHPARQLGAGGLLLAPLWAAGGILVWRQWAARQGALLDQTPDGAGLRTVAGLVEGPPDEDEDADVNEAAGGEDALEVDADLETGTPAEGDLDLEDMRGEVTMPRHGWIERLAWRLMPAHDRTLAAAMMNLGAGWSEQWKLGIKVCAGLLAAGCGLLALEHAFPLLDAWAGVARGWIWALTAAALVLSTWPLSNQIPRAADQWSLGQQRMPFFAALPVGVRDLLRISTRLTVARGVVFALTAMVVLTALAHLLAMPENPWYAVQTAPVLTVMWIFSRPLTVHFRLTTVSGFRQGAALNRVLTELPMAVFCVVWLVTIFAVPVAAGVSKPSLGVWLGALLPGMLANAISARMVFEIFLWRVRTGKVDFMRAGG